MKEYRMVPMQSIELGRRKKIFIATPKSYKNKEKHFPVLYMHDGQNLFDDTIAFMNRSWRILDLFNHHDDLPEVIIVGIESDKEERSNELIPYPFHFQNGKKAGGDARKYLDFIVHTVKPYIDRNYRSFKSPDKTAIMGSSFGGVNSLFAALHYQEYFGRFACVSNALQFDGYFKPLLKDIMSTSFDSIHSFYMDVGDRETGHTKEDHIYVEKNKELYENLRSHIDDSRLLFRIVKDGIHHESSWEERFPAIIKFLFDE